MTDSGKCLVVPVGMIGLSAMWIAAVALMLWSTISGPDLAARWGLLSAAGAATWTVIYALGRYQAMLRAAFELGREAGRTDNLHDALGL